MVPSISKNEVAWYPNIPKIVRYSNMANNSYAAKNRRRCFYATTKPTTLQTEPFRYKPPLSRSPTVVRKLSDINSSIPLVSIITRKEGNYDVSLEERSLYAMF
uniref:MSP domain-containing protein n=1 Tax=Heterorhabditis bacteriophora TaxID=37862 RepID=A0A1I7WQC9_HETBA